jgi:hypothetical protein
MEEETELSIEELVDELEMLKWEKGINTLRITEEFPKNGRQSYIVNNLHMCVDDQLVMCHDENSKIQKMRSVLLAFYRGSVLSIHKIYTSGMPYETILFKDGNVTITIA